MSSCSASVSDRCERRRTAVTIPLDPAAGKPVGLPFQVSKFDGPRLMIPRWIAPVGLSLTQDRLALTVAEESGNIGILDNVDR
jgi:hypothetical protein